MKCQSCRLYNGRNFGLFSLTSKISQLKWTKKIKWNHGKVMKNWRCVFLAWQCHLAGFESGLFWMVDVLVYVCVWILFFVIGFEQNSTEMSLMYWITNDRLCSSQDQTGYSGCGWRDDAQESNHKKNTKSKQRLSWAVQSLRIRQLT